MQNSNNNNPLPCKLTHKSNHKKREKHAWDFACVFQCWILVHKRCQLQRRHSTNLVEGEEKETWGVSPGLQQVYLWGGTEERAEGGLTLSFVFLRDEKQI